MDCDTEEVLRISNGEKCLSAGREHDGESIKKTQGKGGNRLQFIHPKGIPLNKKAWRHHNGTIFAFKISRILKCKKLWNPTNSERRSAMTTTAIALFGSRISPRFDCAQEFMVVTSSENTVTDQYTETIQNPIPLMKIRRLADLKVNILICGGIDEASREQLKTYGIKIIANIKGSADEAASSHISTALTCAPAAKLPMLLQA